MKRRKNSDGSLGGESDAAVVAVAEDEEKGMALEEELKLLEEPVAVEEQASRLIKLVERNPRAIKEVFIRSKALELWRIEVLWDLYQRYGEMDVEKSSRVLTISEDLEMVKQLMVSIRKVVINNLGDCFQLTLVDPESIRLTLEVIDLYGDFQREKVGRIKDKLRGKGEDDLAVLMRVCAVEDWDGEAVSCLREASELRALEVFSKAHIEASDETSSHQQAMVKAARALLEDLSWAVSAVIPFLPVRYRAMVIFRNSYDNHLTRQLATISEEDICAMEPGDLLETKHFLEQYRELMVTFGNRHASPELKSMENHCMQEYLTKTRNQMTEWYNKIMERKAEIHWDGDNRPFTATPEDLFSIINVHVQVATADGALGGDDLASLLLVVGNVLKAFVAEHMLTLRQAVDRQELDTVDVTLLCATINDYDRLQLGGLCFDVVDIGKEKVAELTKDLEGRGVLQEQHMVMIEDVMDMLKDEEALVTSEASDILAFLVLKDATQGLLSKGRFDPGSGSSKALVHHALRDALLTLTDYFNDLRVWLPPFYFSRLVGSSFDGMLATYVFSVLRTKTPFGDVLEVGQLIRQDNEDIQQLFKEYQVQLEEVETHDVRTKLVVLDDLMAVVEKGGVLEAISPSVGHLLRDLPPTWNVEALLHLASLRGESRDKKGRQEARAKLGELAASYSPSEEKRDHDGLIARLSMSPLTATDKTVKKSFLYSCVFIQAMGKERSQ